MKNCLQFNCTNSVFLYCIYLNFFKRTQWRTEKYFQIIAVSEDQRIRNLWPEVRGYCHQPQFWIVVQGQRRKKKKKKKSTVRFLANKQVYIWLQRGKEGFLELCISLNKMLLYVYKNYFKGWLLICWNLDSKTLVIEFFSVRIIKIVIIYSEPRRESLDGTKSLTRRIFWFF